MDPSPPEISVDAAVVDALVREQHPRFAGEIHSEMRGFDNYVYRLGQEFAVRVPRHPDAVAQIEKEQRWLPEIAARLAVPVPTPVAVGRPSQRLPMPWSIVPWFDGASGDSLAPAVRTPAAQQLAAAALAIHVPAPDEAHGFAGRAAPLQVFDEVVLSFFATAPLDDESREGLLEIWRAGVAAEPWPGPPLWVHSDLHPANLVFDASSGALDAIIDFGDLCVGDPACDLAAAWLVFDDAGRDVFRSRIETSRRYDESIWDRAHAWAAAMPTMHLLGSGGAGRDGAMARQIIASLVSEG